MQLMLQKIDTINIITYKAITIMSAHTEEEFKLFMSQLKEKIGRAHV